MTAAKKTEKQNVDAFDVLSTPQAEKDPQAEVKLPPITKFERGVRVNCVEALSQKVAVKLCEELAKVSGTIVIDFRGRGAVTVQILNLFSRLAKAQAARQYEIYFLRPDDDISKLVQTQGLSQILHIATQNSMIPGFPEDPVPKLDLKMINTFIDSTIETLRTQCNVESKAGKPFLSNTRPVVKGDIIGLITIKSETFNGVVAISLPAPIFLFAMGKMVGEVFTEITDDVASGATELLNIIYGNAKMTLNQQGYKLQKVIPSVIRGNEVSLTHLTSSPTLIIPFDTESGTFHIEIGLTEVHAD